MPRVLVNISRDWAVHFIAPDGRTRISPWLLMGNHDEVRALGEHLGRSDSRTRAAPAEGIVHLYLDLTEHQMAALIERGRGWPSTGYDLRKMKADGKYPPARIPEPLSNRKLG